MTPTTKKILAPALCIALLLVPAIIYFLTGNPESALYCLAGEAVAAILCCLAFLRIVIRPLEKIKSHVEEIQRGNFDGTLRIAPGDAGIVGKVGNAIIQMQQQLNESRTLDQEKLARTKDATRSAIDALPHAVAVVSPEGKIELVNHIAQTLFGLAPGTVAGESTPPWLTALIAQARQSMSRIKPEGYKSAVQIFDKGRELFFLPEAIPLLDAHQKLVGITILLEDATELRQVEEAKSNLLAMVSHELKTPLTSIQMAIHLLNEDPRGSFTPREKELLQTASDDADRLNLLIQRLLDKGRQ